MKKYELIDLLCEHDEEEVCIIFRGDEYEIGGIEHLPEVFDGFFESIPPTIALKAVPREEEEPFT